MPRKKTPPPRKKAVEKPPTPPPALPPILIMNLGNLGSEMESEDSDDCNVPPKKRNVKNVKKPRQKVPISSKFKINAGSEINSLGDLINALKHPESDENQKKLVACLEELNGLVGMTKLKEQIINQILFFMQDLQEPGMFLHTVLYGSPGAGKTTCCHILAKIYSCMGILTTDKVVKASRSDLVGKYLGSTALKTKSLLDSANGGVLFIDEVYSLGNKEQTDSYSKECIDTINEYLSEHVDELICIIAGYKEEVQECFFKYNPGLERRFPWKFTIDDYKIEELFKIMEIQLKNSGWSFDTDLEKYVTELITKNKQYFNGNGGDTRNFTDKCKICHARRIFTRETENAKRVKISKILSRKDIEKGMSMFIDSKKDKEVSDPESISHMYI
jgi:AAA+ superfamily predicted ATPase